MRVVGIYLLVISILSVFLTCYDKYAAKALPRHRVPEKILLGLSALGGSAAMYLTMRMIRHKTRHPKFMAGIPLLFLAQCGIAAGICYFWWR